MLQHGSSLVSWGRCRWRRWLAPTSHGQSIHRIILRGLAATVGRSFSLSYLTCPTYPSSLFFQIWGLSLSLASPRSVWSFWTLTLSLLQQTLSFFALAVLPLPCDYFSVLSLTCRDQKPTHYLAILFCLCDSLPIASNFSPAFNDCLFLLADGISPPTYYYYYSCYSLHAIYLQYSFHLQSWLSI